MMEHEMEAMGYITRCRVAAVAYSTTREFHSSPRTMMVQLMALSAYAIEDDLNHVLAPSMSYSDWSFLLIP